MIYIVDKTQCCGCGACEQICPRRSIELYEDSEGFLYPKVNLKTCINCKLCEKVCPVLNETHTQNPILTFAAENTNEDIRIVSSSGGIFSVIAEHVINEGGVVFGARFNNEWEVVHDYTETLQGLSNFRGSKYVQSRIGNSFKQVRNFLREGRVVLFTGTPCQVMALKKYLNTEYKNLITIDFICHGVPSPKVWKLYLKGISKNQKLKGIEFRNKNLGWKRFSLKCVVNEEIIQEEFCSNLYMKTFLTNLPLRLSCYQCHAKKGKSQSDMTLGDFWGIEKLYPNFDDDKGCSAVIIFNKDMLDFLHHSKLLSVNYNDILLNNYSLENSVSKPINRTYFFYLVSKGNGLKYIYDRCLNDSLLMKIRRFLFRKLRV